MKNRAKVIYRVLITVDGTYWQTDTNRQATVDVNKPLARYFSFNRCKTYPVHDPLNLATRVGVSDEAGSLLATFITGKVGARHVSNYGRNTNECQLNPL